MEGLKNPTLLVAIDCRTGKMQRWIGRMKVERVQTNPATMAELTADIETFRETGS